MPRISEDELERITGIAQEWDMHGLGPMYLNGKDILDLITALREAYTTNAHLSAMNDGLIELNTQQGDMLKRADAVMAWMRAAIECYRRVIEGEMAEYTGEVTHDTDK